MTGRRSNTYAGMAFGQDPLDDPLVVGWDVVIGRDPGTRPGVDSDDVVLMRRFHALDTVPLPSPGFFTDLEQRLAGLYPPPVASPDPVPRVKGPGTGIAGPAPARTRSIPGNSRWVSMQGALAALAIMLVASLLVLYHAVPGPSEPPAIPAAVVPKPTLETMVQLDFAVPLWGMPDATEWTNLELGMFEVAPGTSFTTDLTFYTAVDGPMLLMALSGELTVEPAGPALFYPGNQPGRPPVEISAGTTVSLGPNDAIVYSSADAATGSNLGSEPTLALYGSVGTRDKSLPSSYPRDDSKLSFEYVHLVPGATNDVSVSLQRVELAPFDTFVFEPAANWTYLPFVDPNQTRGLSIAEGALEGLVPESGSRGLYGAAQLRYLKPGPHTISNLGDQTVSFYFLVVEPAPVVATPTP